MTALLRNDLRLLRPVLWAAAVVGAALYVSLPAAALATAVPTYDRDRLLNAAADGWAAASTCFWLATPLFALALGSTAFALERRERWAEWTAMLPVRRRTIVLAKLRARGEWCVGLLAVPAVMLAAGFALRWAALRLANGVAPPVNPSDLLEALQYSDTPVRAAVIAGAAVALFGAAWLASAVLRSPVLAALAAVALVGTPTVWRLADIQVHETGNESSPRDGGYSYDGRSTRLVSATGNAGVGLVLLATGCVVQVRRVSP